MAIPCFSMQRTSAISSAHIAVLPSAWVTLIRIQTCGFVQSTFTIVPCSVTVLEKSYSAMMLWWAIAETANTDKTTRSTPATRVGYRIGGNFSAVEIVLATLASATPRTARPLEGFSEIRKHSTRVQHGEPQGNR